MKEIIFVNSHPIQYFAPLYQQLAKEPDVHLKVIYLSDETVEGYWDPQFGAEFKWDIPLLKGYDYKFLKNYSWRPSIGKGFFGLMNFGIINELRKESKGSLIVVHGWSSFSTVLACCAAFLLGHTVCLRGESAYKQEIKKTTLNRIIKRIFLKEFLFHFVHKFLYIGRQNRLFYKDLGIKDIDLIFTPYSVDNKRFRDESALLKVNRGSIRSSLNIPENSIVILVSGKYIEKKRPMDILKAFAMQDPGSFYLIFMGEGKLRPSLETYMNKHSLSATVRLTGFVNQSEVSKYYSIADVFVMGSGIGETWGLSVNEAMNFNLPLILSDATGCSDDLVNEEVNGFIFKTGNINHLSNCFSEFAKKNAHERQAMGEMSFRMISEYSIERIIDNLKLVICPRGS